VTQFRPYLPSAPRTVVTTRSLCRLFCPAIFRHIKLISHGQSSLYKYHWTSASFSHTNCCSTKHQASDNKGACQFLGSPIFADQSGENRTFNPRFFSHNVNSSLCPVVCLDSTLVHHYSDLSLKKGVVHRHHYQKALTAIEETVWST